VLAALAARIYFFLVLRVQSSPILLLLSDLRRPERLSSLGTTRGCRSARCISRQVMEFVVCGVRACIVVWIFDCRASNSHRRLFLVRRMLNPTTTVRVATLCVRFADIQARIRLATGHLRNPCSLSSVCSCCHNRRHSVSIELSAL
jgi:hypothetical protein